MHLDSVLKEKILILDGGMGTEIFKRTGQKFAYPEALNRDRKDIILAIHRAYASAGADIITTNTLGASRPKLNEHGAGSLVKDLNQAGIELAHKARGQNDMLVAGSIGPLGKLLEPLGELSVNAAHDAFAEQAEILQQCGADFLLLETHIDILEAKTAVLAARDATSLPVAVALTFPLEPNLTVTGSDPAAAAVTFAALDLSFFGVNCGGHPAKIAGFLPEITAHSRAPLVVYANAGVPEKKGDVLTFPLGPEEYLPYAQNFYTAGANIIGGCCGTSPEHIKLIAAKLKGAKPYPKKEPAPMFRATGRNAIITIGRTLPFRRIGENINPFAHKELNKRLKQGDIEPAKKLARRQEKAGADALDINLGKKGDKEPEFYSAAVNQLQLCTRLPLLLDNNSPQSLEGALQIYAGKGIINSITGQEKSYSRLFPLAKKFGAGAILLALDDDGIPDKAQDRIRILEALYKKALDFGFSPHDLLIDPITLAASSTLAAAEETLQVIEHCSKLNIPSIIGLSNISFGLPQRKLLNAAFLTLAVNRGLDSAILDPMDNNLQNTLLAAEVFPGRDPGFKNFLAAFPTASETEEQLKTTDGPDTIEEELFQAILEGEKSRLGVLIKRLTEKGKSGLQILEEVLSPALTKVGEYYEKKIYFLPQLILAAEAMEASSQYLEQYFPAEKRTEAKKKIILATVRGDLHDIGKNIVALVLRNFGYKVMDLGKNIDSETILASAVKEKADFIGLSSLMTTSLDEMEKVVNEKNELAPKIKVIVGGAAVTASFAQKIGADAYGKTALDAVRQLDALIKPID